MKNKKRLIVFIIFLFLNFIPQVFVLISVPENLLNWYSSDDAFYYFKTAQNIAEGKGITFDGISPTNGFHPLWMLICVPIFALARFDLYLPLRILAAIQIILNAGTGYFLYRLLSEKVSELIAWLGAVFWMFFLPIHAFTTKMGLETGLNAFFLMAFLFSVSSITWEDEGHIKQYILRTGLCGIGLLFSRLDNIFLIVMTGVWIVFHGKRFNRIAQIDFILILCSAVISFFLRLSHTENMFELSSFLYSLIALSLVIKPTLLYFFRAFEPVREKSNLKFSILVVMALVISSGFIFAFFFLIQRYSKILQGFSRSAMLIDMSLSVLLVGGHHFLRRISDIRNKIAPEDISLKENGQEWLSRAACYFVPIILALSIYLLINLNYAGTAMPVSGQIKRWWGTLPNTVYGRPISTLTGVVKGIIDPSRDKGPYWLLMQPLNTFSTLIRNRIGKPPVGNNMIDVVLLFLFGIFSLAIPFLLNLFNNNAFKRNASRIALLPLIAGTFFHTVSYKATGYIHVRNWYWTGESILVTLFYCIILSLLLNKVKKQKQLHIIPLFFTSLMSILIWGFFSISTIKQFPLKGQVPYAYDIRGEERIFASQTEPDDVVGMTGGGLSAYFIPDRTIINLDGLINSAEYFAKLKEGKIDAYLRKHNVDYIYGDQLVLLDSDPYRWVFEGNLTFLEKGPYFSFYKYQPSGIQ